MPGSSSSPATDSGPVPPSPDRIERHVWLIACVFVLGAIGSILATTSVNVAFETLDRELDTSIDQVQWISTGYLLGLASVIATTGWLVRRFGARRVYLSTLAMFAASSVLCSLASTIEQLIAFRVLQGVTGGATMPVGMMMLASAAGPERMGRVMSVVGVPMILGPIIGPVLGGVLISELSWHWIFLMNVPMALAALVLGYKLLPAMPTRPAGAFDIRGWLMIVLGAPLFVYGLARAGSGGSIASATALGPILAGAILMGAFVWHAWHAERPLLDVQLWRNSGFAACACTAVLVSASLFGSLLLLPLFFQLVRGEDALQTGLMLMPQGIGTAVSMGIAGRLTDRIGGGRVALGGIVILICATFPLLWFDESTPYAVILVVLVVRGLGMGASIMPATAAAYATLKREDIPDATPQMNMLQRLGGSVGTAILAVVLHGQLKGVGGVDGATSDADPAAVADAFSSTYQVAIVMTTLALIPAVALAIVDSRRLRVVRPGTMVGREPDATTTSPATRTVARVR
jgi:EmrB/QacA subfamily drug resistance transporter